MKFFFATRQSESIVRPLLSGALYRLWLKGVYIIAGNGQVFHEPGIRPNNLLKVGERALHFLRENADGTEIEFVSFGSPLKFLALTSMFGGTSTPDYPQDLPQRATDLSQTIIEYMELLDDEDFGLESDFLFVAEKQGESYTLGEKVGMFMTHKLCPQLDYEPSYLAQEAYWVSRLNAFVTEHKQATCYKLKLPLITHEDDNRQQPE